MHCSRNKRAILPHEALGWWANERCTEKVFGFNLAMFEVWLLSTSQPPEWRFPKLYFDWKEGSNRTGEGGICRHGLGPINFMYLCLLSAVSGNMTFLVCDAASSHAPGKNLFLLISYKTEFHIAEFPFNKLHTIHICWKIWSQLRETNDFC